MHGRRTGGVQREHAFIHSEVEPGWGVVGGYRVGILGNILGILEISWEYLEGHPGGILIGAKVCKDMAPPLRIRIRDIE